VYELNYNELRSINLVEKEDKNAYLEVKLEDDEGNQPVQRFKFDNKNSASSLALKIRLAKADFDETSYILYNNKDDDS
jgi:hypothetical protein